MNIIKERLLLMVFLISICCSINLSQVEILELRDESSKTFQNFDGTRDIYIYISPIHILDTNTGTWQDIEEGDIILNPTAFTIKKFLDNSYNIQNLQILLGKTLIGSEHVDRGYFWWSTSQIPPNSTINNATFTIGVNNNFNVSNIQCYKMDNNPGSGYPNPALLAGIYDDCGNGTLYRTISSTSAAFQNYSIFNQDLQSRLNSQTGWMAVGFKNTDENNQDKYLDFAQINGVLTVNYTSSSPYLAINPKDIVVSGNGGENLYPIYVFNSGNNAILDYEIIYNVNWFYPNWFGIGQTPDTRRFNVRPNFSGALRTTTLEFKGWQNGIQINSQLLTVTQPPVSEGLLCNLGIINNFAVYIAINGISICNTTVGNSGDLTLQAGNYIDLQSGFEVLAGGKLDAFLQTLDAYTISNLQIDHLYYSTGKFINNKVNKKKDNNIFAFNLLQNYPNPFNPTTLIHYSLKENINVKITVYDILGRIVKVLVNDYQNAGYKSVIWEGTNDNGQQVASGIYIYKIEAGSFVNSKKMLFLK